MQEVDAERRLQLLRGSQITPQELLQDQVEQSKLDTDSRSSRKRKRLNGEDDTDRDIRLAREDAVLSSSRKISMAIPRKSTSDAPLTDHKGHISLFPDERSRLHVVKNSEAEAETAKKTREYEDQYTMRFSNAAGFKQGLANPWYATMKGETMEKYPGDEKAWGNKEYRRQEREKAKMHQDDPLSSMRRSVQALKKVERERRVSMEERDQQLRQMEREQRQSRRRSSKRRNVSDNDDLESFTLDPPSSSKHASSRPTEEMCSEFYAERRRRAKLHNYRDESKGRAILSDGYRSCRDNGHRKSPNRTLEYKTRN